MKLYAFIILLYLVFGLGNNEVLASEPLFSPDKVEMSKTTGDAESTSEAGSKIADGEVAIASPNHQIIAYYIHGNFRCATCRKIEALSEDALLQAFSDELDRGKLVWRVVNMDKEEHYAEDYQLVSQALVLVEMENGKQLSWRNLQRVWELVGDGDKFLDYVQKETREFIGRIE